MKHYGDITKLSGYDLPIVDVITGGSPCQDLSTAGKRAGLEGERSGLFMEQIRIVKEMRERDRKDNGRTAEFVRPRFMVWENVPGALSSNSGFDFQAVLTEIVRIAEPSAPDVPLFGGGGRKRWSKSGCLYDEMGRWSIAWRVHDAQFWGATQFTDGRVSVLGTPQRRKRIALVADFGGLSAGEILFERKGLSGNYQSVEPQREGTAEASENSLGESGEESYTVKVRGGREFDSYGKRAGKGALIQKELSGTLGVSQDQTLFANNTYSLDEKMGQTYVHNEQGNTLSARDYKQPQAVVYGISAYESNAMKSSNPNSGIYEAETSRTLDLNGGSPACNQGGTAIVNAIGCDAYNHTLTGDIVATLNASSGESPTRSGPSVITANECSAVYDASRRHDYQPFGDVSETVQARYGTGGGNVPLVAKSEVYDARGNGNGEVAPTMTGDHQNRVTDYTALCVDRNETVQQDDK